MPSTKKSINVRLDDDVYEYVKELADGYGLSMSAVVRSVLDARLPIIAKEKYTPQQFELIMPYITETSQRVGNCEITLGVINDNLVTFLNDYLENEDADELKSYLNKHQKALIDNLKELYKISEKLMDKW